MFFKVALQISLRNPFNADVKDVIKGSVKGVIKYLINKYHMTEQLKNRGVQLVDFFIK